jgi:hypothetical protein
MELFNLINQLKMVNNMTTKNNAVNVTTNETHATPTLDIKERIYTSYSDLANSVGNIKNTDGTINENHLKRATIADSVITQYRVQKVVIEGVTFERFSIQLKRNLEWYTLHTSQFLLLLQDVSAITLPNRDGSDKHFLRGAVDGTCQAGFHTIKQENLLDKYIDFRNWYVIGLTKVSPRSSLYLAEVLSLSDLVNMPDKIESYEDSKAVTFSLVDYRLQIDDNITVLPLPLIQASYDAYINAGFTVKLLACYKLES